MNKPRFNLKNKAERETLISLIYRPFKERLVFSTGLKIPPRYWNYKALRAKATQDFMEHSFINFELDKIESMATEIARKYKAGNKALTALAFKSEMDHLYHGKLTQSTVKDFSSFIDKFVEERSKSSQYKTGSVQVYNTAKKHFNLFARAKTIRFEDLSVDFFHKFIQYLYDKDFSNNHINKILTTIRTMLNDATERGYNQNLEYKSRKISVSKTVADNIYLTENELQALIVLDLSKNERLDKVRDLFIVGSYTGLRYSDFSILKPQNLRSLDGVKIFDTTIEKTKDRLIIPLHPLVDPILTKYDNILPQPISNQKMNDYLKELCESAGINETIIKREHRGGKMYEESYKKYEMVSSHTARRSFATNAYKAGVPMLSIMRITGHKRPEVFLKYIKVDNEENALLMAKHAFFTK
ncbi:MAG: site-specific integrase [Saprospiraceae bacterium]|nr:site-specific integrase [Saprospiraceae bacterium]